MVASPRIVISRHDRVNAFLVSQRCNFLPAILGDGEVERKKLPSLADLQGLRLGKEEQELVIAEYQDQLVLRAFDGGGGVGQIKLSFVLNRKTSSQSQHGDKIVSLLQLERENGRMIRQRPRRGGSPRRFGRDGRRSFGGGSGIGGGGGRSIGGGFRGGSSRGSSGGSRS